MRTAVINFCEAWLCEDDYDEGVVLVEIHPEHDPAKLRTFRVTRIVTVNYDTTLVENVTPLKGE